MKRLSKTKYTYLPTCTEPWCGERPEYLATTQVHLYEAGTTTLHLDGECKHRPPQGETPGDGDLCWRQPPPANPTTPSSPHTMQPGTGHQGAPAGHGRGGREKEGEPEKGRGKYTVSRTVSCKVHAATGTPGAVRPEPRDGPATSQLSPLPRVVRSSPSLRQNYVASRPNQSRGVVRPLAACLASGRHGV